MWIRPHKWRTSCGVKFSNLTLLKPDYEALPLSFTSKQGLKFGTRLSHLEFQATIGSPPICNNVQIQIILKLEEVPMPDSGDNS
jgi:hypothetical protein